MLRPIREALTHAWVAGGGDPMARTLRSDHPQAPLEATELIAQRIDHVFVRAGQPGVRIDVESVAVIGDPVDGLHPSDHRGVSCDVTWTSIT